MICTAQDNQIPEAYRYWLEPKAEGISQLTCCAVIVMAPCVLLSIMVDDSLLMTGYAPS